VNGILDCRFEVPNWFVLGVTRTALKGEKDLEVSCTFVTTIVR